MLAKIRRGLWLIYTRVSLPNIGSLGARSIVMPTEQIVGQKYLHIGDRVFIRSHARLDAIAGWGDQTFTPEIRIGDGTHIEHRLQITSIASVMIGCEVLIASNVFISDHSHDYKNIDIPVVHQPLTTGEPVSIGDGSWIGQNVVILPGTHLGKHCIVGANSVVKGIFVDNTVLAGIPARAIRHYDPKTEDWIRS